MSASEGDEQQLQQICKMCGGKLKLAAALPKALGDAGYRISICLGCGLMHWLPLPDG